MSRAAAAMEIASTLAHSSLRRTTSSNRARCTVVTGRPATNRHSVGASCALLRVSPGSDATPPACDEWDGQSLTTVCLEAVEEGATSPPKCSPRCDGTAVPQSASGIQDPLLDAERPVGPGVPSRRQPLPIEPTVPARGWVRSHRSGPDAPGRPVLAAVRTLDSIVAPPWELRSRVGARATREQYALGITCVRWGAVDASRAAESAALSTFQVANGIEHGGLSRM